jgi:hypothetical protein
VEPLPGRPDLRYRGLYRELFAICAQPPHLAQHAQGSWGHPRLAETACLLAVRREEPIGEKSVNRLAYRFGGRTREHCLGGAIEEDYSAALIDYDEAIDSRIDDAFKPLCR